VIGVSFSIWQEDWEEMGLREASDASQKPPTNLAMSGMGSPTLCLGRERSCLHLLRNYLQVESTRRVTPFESPLQNLEVNIDQHKAGDNGKY